MTETPDPDEWLYWSGLNYDADTIAWLKRAPGVIFWAETPLTDQWADLLITYEGVVGVPIRIPPGWWVHFDGRYLVGFERRPQ